MGKEICPTCGGELSTRWLTEEIHGGTLQSFSMGEYCPTCELEPKGTEAYEEATQRLRSLVGREVAFEFTLSGITLSGKDINEVMPRKGVLKTVGDDGSIELDGRKFSLYEYSKTDVWAGNVLKESTTFRLTAIKCGEEIIFSAGERG